MAIAEPITSADDVTEELNVTPESFRLGSRDLSELQERIDRVLRSVSAYVQRTVGSGNYAATTNEVAFECIRRAELCLACKRVIRQYINVLSSAPEGVIHQDVDLSIYRDMMDEYQAEADELLHDYITSTAAMPDELFEMGTTGVDETQGDDYSGIDYGYLEDQAQD